MTREEAKDYIREWCPYDRQEEIIKALEQEPCDDAISRQAVLDLVNADWKYEGLEEPINSLPPVTPQPKTGHWIPSHIPESILDECSECGFSCGAFTFNFCPNCGAKMIDPQESERINCKTTKCENCQNHNFCDYEPQERSKE